MMHKPKINIYTWCFFFTKNKNKNKINILLGVQRVGSKPKVLPLVLHEWDGPKNQLWSRGKAIRNPKTQTSSSSSQTGNFFCRLLCFASFVFSFLSLASCFMAFLGVVAAALIPSILGVDCSKINCSAACNWLYLSTYSGNIFLKTGLYLPRHKRYKLV